MKKMKIYASALEIRDANPILGKELRAVKLSFEQAMSFDSDFSSLEEGLSKYGHCNMLKPGEFYDGYVAIYSVRWDVVRFRGCINKVTKIYELTALPLREACAREELYEVVCPLPDGTTTQGCFKYVWTFYGCRFADWAKQLQQNNHLASEIDPQKIDKSIKDKLVNALINNTVASLTDEEHLVLESYAPDFHRKFFCEV